MVILKMIGGKQSIILLNKSDLDKMSKHIDLTTPKLRPWNDGQLDKLKQLLDDM